MPNLYEEGEVRMGCFTNTNDDQTRCFTRTYVDHKECPKCKSKNIIISGNYNNEVYKCLDCNNLF